MNELEKLVAMHYGREHEAEAVQEIGYTDYLKYLKNEMKELMRGLKRATKRKEYGALMIASGKYYPLSEHYKEISKDGDDSRYFICDNELKTRLAVPKEEINELQKTVGYYR